MKFDFQGQAGTRRFSLAGCQPAACRPRAVRAPRWRGPRRRRRVRARRPAGRRRRRPVPSPAPSRPLPLAARERPARSRATAAAARRRPGPRSESRAGPAGPLGREAAAETAQRSDGTLRSEPGRSPPAPPGGLRCDAGHATSRASRCRVVIGPSPGRDDDLEGSLPAGADGAVDRFGALTGRA